MRKDFNKLITENPRVLHEAKFREYRRAKDNAVFDEDAEGGKESMMKARRRAKGRRKSFGENLSPLLRFLDKQVGQHWDKVHKLICETFDPRSVINNHILQHVFNDFVEVNAKLIDDEVKILQVIIGDSYDYTKPGPRVKKEDGYYDERWVSVNETFKKFYVHPKTGCLLRVKKVSRRQRAEKNKVEHKKSLAEWFVKISDFEELHKQDGIWYRFTKKERPEPVVMYATKMYASEISEARYNKLPLQLQETYSKIFRHPAVKEFHPKGWTGQARKKNLYYDSRQQLNSKELKEHGLQNDPT